MIFGITFNTNTIIVYYLRYIMKQLLFRDVSDKHNPKIIAEMQQDDSDIIPKVGEKMSFHVDKLSDFEYNGSYAKMCVPRTFDVKSVKWWIKGIDSATLEYGGSSLGSIEIELVHDGTEVSN